MTWHDDENLSLFWRYVIAVVLSVAAWSLFIGLPLFLLWWRE